MSASRITPTCTSIDGAPVLEALLAGDRGVAARLLECGIPGDLPLESMPLARRLDQLRRDSSVQPWLLRAMVDRVSGMLLGHIGFHSPPRPEYLATIAPMPWSWATPFMRLSGGRDMRPKRYSP